MGKERRYHKRYCVKGLINRLRESRFLGLLTKPTSKAYPCIDISGGGLQFVTKKAFKLRDRLLLDISTPFTRNDPIRAKGRVVWLKTSRNLDFHLVGVQFVSVNKSQRAELKILMERAGEDKDKIPQRIQIKIIKEAFSRL